jgi:hypothetical protein
LNLLAFDEKEHIAKAEAPATTASDVDSFGSNDDIAPTLEF